MALLNKKHYTLVSDSLSSIRRRLVWKRIDVIGQLAFVFLPQLYPYHDAFFGQVIHGIFVALFAVGGWQVISALLHAVLFPKEWWRNGRTGYYIGLITIMVVALVIAVIQGDAVVGGVMAMLVVGPLMAAWYCAICIGELSNLAKWQRKMKVGVRLQARRFESPPSNK